MTKTPVTPLPAASVVIIRDGAAGIETFMLRRHESSKVAFSGATVFPGGKVDAEDRDPRWAAMEPAPAATPAHEFWIAAVRETWEEAGLLIARAPGARELVGGDVAHALAHGRHGAVEGSDAAGFARMMASAGLVPALDQMVHFGHWITPRTQARRFDTHFFLVAAPATQRDLVDEAESADGQWIAPQCVLDEFERDERFLVAVTQCTLELLATWRTVEQALTAARRRRVATITPDTEPAPGGRYMRIPDDAGYPRSRFFIKGTPR